MALARWCLSDVYVAVTVAPSHRCCICFSRQVLQLEGARLHGPRRCQLKAARRALRRARKRDRLHGSHVACRLAAHLLALLQPPLREAPFVESRSAARHAARQAKLGVRHLQANPARLARLTSGEPLRQPLRTRLVVLQPGPMARPRRALLLALLPSLLRQCARTLLGIGFARSSTPRVRGLRCVHAVRGEKRVLPTLCTPR